MYCKYCGSRIASDDTKCASCGADIDLNDGGQSFFDDNELIDWQNENTPFGTKTSVPKTEMREPLPEKNAFEEDEKTFIRPQSSVGARDTYSRRRPKKEKKILDFLNLSGSNKLIIFCIASALAIVLLTVAIIAVLNSGKDESNSDGVQPSYSTSINSESSVDDTNKVVAQNTEKKEDNEEDKEEVKGIRILINNQEISHPVSAYIISSKIYISIDRVLKAEGYKNGVKTEYNENRIRYDHTKTSKAIEIEKGTNKIWIRENDEDVDTKYLDGANFNEGSDTYVAAKSFFNMLGYSKVEYDNSTKTLSISK